MRKGCGALRLTPGEGDVYIHHLPGVAAAMAGPLPPAADLTPFVSSIYDQGETEACVMFSSALMASVQDAIDRGEWHVYDALGAYHAIGGDDRSGVDARLALEYIRTTGLQAQGGVGRHKISSYAFVKQSPELFSETLKAAIVARQPCVLACHLPVRFGWNSSGPAVPEMYHQMCLLGYDAEGNFIVGNSWGATWGKAGFGRLSVAFLEDGNFQAGDCYAWTTVDTAVVS